MIETGQQILERLRADREIDPNADHELLDAWSPEWASYVAAVEDVVRDLAKRAHDTDEILSELATDSPRIYRDQVVVMLADNGGADLSERLTSFFSITDAEIGEQRA